MLPAQLLSVLHRPLWMPSPHPPFAKCAKDGAPSGVVVLRCEGRATRPPNGSLRASPRRARVERPLEVLLRR